MELTTLILLH